MGQQVERVPLARRQNIADIARHRRIVAAGGEVAGPDRRPARVERAVAAIAHPGDVDVAKGRAVAVADVAHRFLLIPTARGDEVEAVRASQIIAVVVGERILRIIFKRERQIRAPVGEIAPDDRGGEAVACVALLRDARLSAHRKAVIITFQHEIDHARHAVGAVHRARRTGQHVDALDQVGRDRVNVDRGGVDLAGHVAAAVHQHESTVRPQPAQVEQVEAGIADGAVGLRVARGTRAVARVGECGDALQEIGDVGLPRLLDLGGIERDDWVRRLVIGTADARSGDHDVAAVTRRRSRCGGRIRRILRHSCDVLRVRCGG